MPIHDLGYRSWDGEYLPRHTRWLVFTRVGLALALRSRWLKRLVMFSFVQAVIAIALLYAAEQFIFVPMSAAGAPGQPGPGRMMAAQLPVMLRFGLPIGLWTQEDIETVQNSMDASNPDAEKDSRYHLWKLGVLGMIRSPQAILMVLVLGILVPPMISFDMRSRAFLLYFARPITPVDYVVGKSLIVWAFLFAITAAPALLTYFMSVLVCSTISVVTYTWDIPLRILLCSTCLALPVTALALCFSALTTESRKASFAWFVTWAVGMMAYLILTGVEADRAQFNQRAAAQQQMSQGVAPGPGQMRGMRPGPPPWGEVRYKWIFLSLFHTLGDVESWLFGVGPRTLSDISGSLTLLILLTGGCYYLVFRRVMAPMRV